MLSYRHSFHAGNYADVLKHFTLQRIFSYLVKKEKPIHYIDSHAGAGGYALHSPEAEKTGEYIKGIMRLAQRDDRPELLDEYLALVKQFHYQKDNLRHYPGSPWIAAHSLREQDRLFLYELHPSDHKQLLTQTRKDKRVQVKLGDGFKGALAHLPPISRRGLLLIDPPYEIKSDYQKVVKLIVEAHKRFATGCIALWYPVVERGWVNELETAIKATGIANSVLFELSQSADRSGYGMTASGMIVINPPWTLKSELDSVLPYLADVLGEQGQGKYRSEQLTAE
ncbi:23S rRNA (adenine(2030)-N(6))-methyltransferase RlmJ [Celerinatantimonas sp. MCCC 1A17872]|uniref:23S rRNA (adenine(2030)-N(6))-methyltransferase RlmJ n=1 Tax=Celerinatantimonas sp. MCCC 1A17872 TaxID=3177514 RepID=UPI0038BEB461